MRILLHGDDIEASRAEFLRLKGNRPGIDGAAFDETALAQAGSSLLGDPVFIERLLTKKPKLAALVPDGAVLWENKEIGAAVVKKLGPADVKLFKLPSVLFQFLDTFSPELYGKLGTPERTHAMLAKRIRQLLQVKDHVTPEGLQGWQAARLTAQAKRFTMDKLRAMYKNLLDIEFLVKSGRSPFTLRQLTERFLAEL